MSAMETLPGALTDDLIEEFFLRIPPEDPVSLVHAALVCKRCCRILADRGFRRRFTEHHHQRPPMLGFFCFGPTAVTMRPLLIPTSSFRPRNAAAISINYMKAIDSRHGRVLISDSTSWKDPSAGRLSVWDPNTGKLLTLPRLPPGKPLPPNANFFTWNAVLLCDTSTAGAGCCDCNCDCRGGLFVVVFVGTSRDEAYAFVYSSQAGVWRHTTSVARHSLGHISCTRLFHAHDRASAVAGDAVFFKLFMNDVGILKYDLGSQEISSVDLPDQCRGRRNLLFTTTEYGGVLGVAAVDNTRIELWWSREAGQDGRFGWEPARVIELQDVHQANPCLRLEPRPHDLIYVVDIVYSLGAIIINPRAGVFSVDIESKKATMLCDNSWTSWFVPYLGFCTPALGVAFTEEGSSAGVSKSKEERRTQISIRRIIKCLVVIIGLWVICFVVHRFAAGFWDGRHMS